MDIFYLELRQTKNNFDLRFYVSSPDVYRLSSCEVLVQVHQYSGWKSSKTPKKRLFLRSKLTIFKSKLHPEDVVLWKIWWNYGEREFLLVSEYRIRFFIAFTVLEILADLWTTFSPFWPKMPTLRLNIWRTEKDFDMRFFGNARQQNGLHFHQFGANSLE